MVPEIFLTGPVCVEGAGDPLHGLKTVPVHLIEQCLKCDRLQWTSPLSDPPKNKLNCGDNFREDSVSSEESGKPLCLPVWLEGFLYLHVTKKPLHEPSRSSQSWFSKQCLENGRLSQSSQTPSTESDEEPLKSEGSSVSGDVPAVPLCLPVGLEGCLYVQDIKKPVQALKSTQTKKKITQHCNTLKTSSTTKGVDKENQGSTFSKHGSPDGLETSIYSQDVKTPLQASKPAKTCSKKSDVKIDNLQPISQSLRPVELRPRCQKVFVSGETSAVQALLPEELEESIVVQDIKNPCHESKTLGAQLNKQNHKCDNPQSVKSAPVKTSEKKEHKDSTAAGLSTGQSRLPVGLERALYIHDIKKPMHVVASAQNGFNKLSQRLDSLLKRPESTNLKGEKKRQRETVVSGRGAGRHCVPVKLEDTLFVQDIKKPANQTRTTSHRVTKQSLKRDKLHTKSSVTKLNKDKQKSRDTLAFEVTKTHPSVRLNESLHVQALKNPQHKANTSETPLPFKKQNLNSNKNLVCCPSTSRKEKLFLEENPEEWYRHNIGLERCLNIQPIKNPLHQAENAQQCLGKRCLKCEKLLLASQDKKKLKYKVDTVAGECGPAGYLQCQENQAALGRANKHMFKGSDLHRPLHKPIRKVRK